MKVSIIAGGRFHAFHLAHQLQLHNALEKLYTFSYAKHDQHYVAPSHVKQFFIPALLDKAFQKGQVYRFIPASTYNVYKDNIFDRLVSRSIDPWESDLFICWAHYAATTIKKIRKNTNAKIVIESGSCHILEQQKFLKQGYTNAGLSYPPIHPKNSKKMLHEYEQADFIMTPSEFARQSFIRQGFDPKKILKVTYGVNTHRFNKQEPDAPSVKKFRVLFVGLLSIQKGTHLLLDAWNDLDIPEAESELILVGNPRSDFQEIIKKKKIKSNVIFFGSTSQEKLKQLYHNASVFVLPSLQEGCAMVIGEAMASGLPVICSTHTGADELITDGKEGFLIPPYDIKAIQEKILWCYHNQEQAQAMGAQGHQTVQRFTWDYYGEQVYKAYQAIVANVKE